MEAIKVTNDTEKQNYKLNNDEFWAILKENYCLYSDTARAITQKYGIPYSRQAVQRRAKRFAKEIARYKGEMRDLAHRTIFDAIKQDKDIKLRYRASLYMLDKIDKDNSSDSPTKKNK